MAVPVVNSVTAVPSTVGPGGQSTITINASDPDSIGNVTLNIVVTDAGGATGTGQVVVNVQDPLTYQVTVQGGAPNGTVVQTATPNVWTYTAP